MLRAPDNVCFLFSIPQRIAIPVHVRWINLWPPDSFAEDFEITGGSRRLQEEDDDASTCFAETSSDLGALVYVGNLVLFAGILGALITLHISLASGVEAYWLTKVRRQSRAVRSLFVRPLE